jgi:Tol biopolymer transport system component
MSAPLQAQYFGRNAVQYETFKFKVLRTQHFDVYFYDKEAESAAEAARMAERWYARLSSVLHHELSGRQPLILYADHPDFEQTNVLGEQPGEGTGGVTESLKRRIILPMGGSLKETDHVIGHELVHAFQYDITGVGRGSMATGLNRVPLWFVEGMAEYLSIGPVDPNTTMWMRDAVRTGTLPDLGDLENPEYFPYRWGQSFWAYIGGTYGDDAIASALRLGGKTGNVQTALATVTHRPADSLIAEWHRALVQTAQPVALATNVELPADKNQAKQARRTNVTATGGRLLVAVRNESRYNIAPAVSPDGSRMVYLSDAGLFSIDLYLADAQTGKTIRKLISSTRDPHLESMQFINSAGAWDSSGSRFVFGAVVTGKPALRIVNGGNGSLIREIKFPTLGEIFNPTWSPDGNAIAFSAQVGGLTDLFIYDISSGQLQRLTDDPYADLEPAWSPDGSSIAFVTDRFGTNLAQLSYGEYQLAVVNVRDRGTENPQITSLATLPGATKHINPQWSPDGRSLFFLADPGGVTNLYRLGIADGAIAQVTNLYTGIAGITPLSPALSVAQRTSRAVFSVYTNGGYGLQSIDDPQVLAGRAPTPVPAEAATLPPLQRQAGLTTVLTNETIGLPAEPVVTAANLVKPYKPHLSLDLIAQPSLAVAADRFGTYIGGGITLFWSDMLGDHNLVTQAQINGRISDFAGLVAYQNRKSRLNWTIGAQRIPYITGAFAAYFDGSGRYVEEIERFKQTVTGLTGIVAYPFNRSRRVEFSAGVQQIGFSHELRRTAFFSSGDVAFDSTIHFDVPGSLSLGTATAALVHDNSFFGATSPILGDRWRLEVTPTFGSLNFITALGDYRRYFMPLRPFTLAGRILHIGRYGGSADDQRIYPLYIGYPSLVRGYDIGSFNAGECGNSSTSCPVFDQLIGSKMLVGNVELRFPPFGLLGLGGGYYGILPIEAALFYDAGLAWTGSEGAQVFGNGPRQVVSSAGVSLRMNLMGYAVGQMDFVRPFDRPGKGWMLRFSLTPGF